MYIFSQGKAAIVRRGIPILWLTFEFQDEYGNLQ